MFRKIWEKIKKEKVAKSVSNPKPIEEKKIDTIKDNKAAPLKEVKVPAEMQLPDFSFDDLMKFLVGKKINFQNSALENGLSFGFIARIMRRYADTPARDLVTLLIKDDADFSNKELKQIIQNLKNPDLLLLMICTVNYDGLRKIIELGVDIHIETKENYSALYVALALNHPEMVKVLISSGANIDFIPKHLSLKLENNEAMRTAKTHEMEGFKAFLSGFHSAPKESDVYQFRHDGLYDKNIVKQLLPFINPIKEKKALPNTPPIIKYVHPGDTAFSTAWDAFEAYFETRFLDDVLAMQPHVNSIKEKKETLVHVKLLLKNLQALIKSKKCYSDIQSFSAEAKEKERQKISGILIDLTEALQELEKVESLEWYDAFKAIIDKNAHLIEQHGSMGLPRQLKLLDKNIISVVNFMKRLENSISVLFELTSGPWIKSPLEPVRDALKDVLPASLKNYKAIESLLTFESHPLILQRRSL